MSSLQLTLLVSFGIANIVLLALWFRFHKEKNLIRFKLAKIAAIFHLVATVFSCMIFEETIRTFHRHPILNSTLILITGICAVSGIRFYLEAIFASYERIQKHIDSFTKDVPRYGEPEPPDFQ